MPLPTLTALASHVGGPFSWGLSRLTSAAESLAVGADLPAGSAEGRSGLVTAVVICVVVLVALNVVLWLVSRVLRRVTIVDPFWGLGFVAMMAALVMLMPATGPRGWLSVLLVSAWGIRYAYHLYTRPWGHDEANQYYPYAKMREKHGAAFATKSLWIVFLPQAAGNLVIGMPLLAAFTAQAQAVDIWMVAGVVVIITGLLIEAIADAQLAAHKGDASRRGTVLDTGLWSMSRHPNYFGDALLWWGLWLLAVGGGGGWTVFSPVIMTILLAKVTGVPMVERHSKIAKTPAYSEYATRTPAFVPNPVLYRRTR